MPEIFISYDSSDEYWRARFDDVFGRAYPYRFVRPDAVPEEGAFYGRELRDKGYLTDETVVVVLIGPKAYSSKKVDWEIAAALDNGRVRPAGVLAVRVPTHEDYQKPSVNPRRIPIRIADNLKSGYLRLYDWTESERELESRLYAALKDARGRANLIKNSRSLMERDMFR
ncbi:MAG TPA: TIR domain-containing protein [bacterium]|nr:TIR domain-containing protein [bacterium]